MHMLKKAIVLIIERGEKGDAEICQVLGAEGACRIARLH
jgi:hypothetical protein